MKLSDLPVGMIHVLCILLSFVCIAAVMGLIRSAGKKELRNCFLFSLLSFVATFVPLHGIEWYLHALIKGIEPPKYAAIIIGLPAYALFALAFIFLFFVFFTLLRIRLRLLGILSNQSVVEGLDRLPDGIFFCDANGTPLLINEKMHEICFAAFGFTSLNYTDLRRRIDHEEFQSGCSLTRHGESIFLTLPNESVWSLQADQFDSRFGTVTELIAVNVTDLYKTSEELMQRNNRLEAVNRQIMETNKNMDIIIREREILAAKIRVHNALGSSLLHIRSYLSQTDGDREKLLAQLQTSVFLFHNDEFPQQSASIFASLEEAAHAIGVNIQFDGVLPDCSQNVVSTAIHECVTNTVKHAHGKTLYVESRCIGTQWTICFTNDGDPPNGEIQETGGLQNLRKMAERHGVKMIIQSSPRFKLILEFSKYPVPETERSICYEV